MNFSKNLLAALGTQELTKSQRLVFDICLAQKLRTRDPEDITIRELKAILRMAREHSAGAGRQMAN